MIRDIASVICAVVTFTMGFISLLLLINLVLNIRKDSYTADDFLRPSIFIIGAIALTFVTLFLCKDNDRGSSFDTDMENDDPLIMNIES